jgi:hypothetical protein
MKINRLLFIILSVFAAGCSTSGSMDFGTSWHFPTPKNEPLWGGAIPLVRAGLGEEDRKRIASSDQRTARIKGDPWIHFEDNNGCQFEYFYKGNAAFVTFGLEGYTSVVLVGVNDKDFVEHYAWCDNEGCWKVVEKTPNIVVNVSLSEFKKRKDKIKISEKIARTLLLNYSKNTFLMRAGIPYPVDQEAFLSLLSIPTSTKKKIAELVVPKVNLEEHIQHKAVEFLWSMHIKESGFVEKCSKNKRLQLINPSRNYYHKSNILLRRVFALTWRIEQITNQTVSFSLFSQDKHLLGLPFLAQKRIREDTKSNTQISISPTQGQLTDTHKPLDSQAETSCQSAHTRQK